MRLHLFVILLAILAASVAIVADSSAASTEPDLARVSRKPRARTAPAYGIERIGAVIRGWVNPRGRYTIWHWQIGRTTAYGHILPEHEIEEGFTYENFERGAYEVEEPVECLRPGTTYHYRIVALNSAGKVRGQDMTFTTEPASGSLKGVYSECPGHKPI